MREIPAVASVGQEGAVSEVSDVAYAVRQVATAVRPVRAVSDSSQGVK